MATEIERKFLVTQVEKAISQAVGSKYVYQAYLSTDPDRTVRITHTKPAFNGIRNLIEESEKYYLCIKGKLIGASRPEYEYKITKEDFEGLLLMSQCSLEKIRYYIPCGNHTYELDYFLGANSGLVIAEIELKSEDEQFIKPSWLGKDVTDDLNYYNLNIAMKNLQANHGYGNLKENYA